LLRGYHYVGMFSVCIEPSLTNHAITNGRLINILTVIIATTYKGVETDVPRSPLEIRVEGVGHYGPPVPGQLLISAGPAARGATSSESSE
jgi:hypothetical protein